MFTIGGFSGLMLAIAPADYQYHDTYFVVAHFHYVMSLGAVFCIFAGIYFYIGKMSGRQYPEWAGKLHFWLMFIGFNLTFGISGVANFAYGAFYVFLDVLEPIRDVPTRLHYQRLTLSVKNRS